MNIWQVSVVVSLQVLLRQTSGQRFLRTDGAGRFDGAAPLARLPQHVFEEVAGTHLVEVFFQVDVPGIISGVSASRSLQR